MDKKTEVIANIRINKDLKDSLKIIASNKKITIKELVETQLIKLIEK